MEAAIEESPQPEPGLGRFVVPALAIAMVLAFASAVTLGLFWVRDRDTNADEVGSFLADQKPAVEKTVTKVVDLLTNYDATNIDDVVDEMLGITTGSFRKDYQDTFERGFGNAIKKASTSARGQILTGPDVSFRSADEAVAVVRVQQTIQNNQLPEGRTYVDVMQITLINTSDGGWKADRVEILGGQQAQ